VFQIETRVGSEIAFDADRALGYAPAGVRAGLRAEYERRVLVVRRGQGEILAF
jgi:hypothetical protein